MTASLRDLQRMEQRAYRRWGRALMQRFRTGRDDEVEREAWYRRSEALTDRLDELERAGKIVREDLPF